MTEFRKILYATDFSESSGPAAAHALYLAGLTGAHLHVLHVVGELADPRKSLMQPEAYARLEREVEVQAVRELEAFCREKFEGRVSYTTDIVLGAPTEQILTRAREVAADLIVMGTHGRTGLEHVVVGSTAERVVRLSPIPVLTVRAET